ncbi:MAG: fibronectin type III domain-containing protein [Flavobacteriaceae bacterium]|nr:fibronectin type III domain-containing protein [Flavobacteriaceae bacterium]
MKKITLFFCLVFTSALMFAQCINTYSYLTITSDNSGETQPLSYCIYTSEYHTINGIIVGDDYLFKATQSDVHKYITITDVSNTVIAYGASPLTVTGITSTDIRMHVTEDAACAFSTNCHKTSILSMTNAPACGDPINFMASTTTSSADLSWEAGETGTPVEYYWEVQPDGVAQGTAGAIANDTTTGLMATVNGLTSYTDYDFFVKANCDSDGTSNWAGPFSFTTLGIPPPNDNICDAIQITVDATSAGDAFTNFHATEQFNEPVGSCFNSGIDGSVWFWFTAPDSGNVRVTTDITGGTLTNTEVAVYEAPSDCLDASTMGTELGCNQDGGVNLYGNSILDLSGLTAGTVYYIQVDSWSNYNNGTFGLEVQELAPCLDPTNLNATIIAETTAYLGWTENNSATMWNIEWGTAGFTQGSGTMITGVTNNPYNLTGLNGETDYDFYVQTNCSSSGTSSWVGPFTFTTLGAGPPNDNICDAIEITLDASSQGNAFSNVNASPQLGEPVGDCFSAGINGSVWFYFTAPDSGNVKITTDIAGGTLNDTEIAVYEAPTDCLDAETMGTQLGCDQDSGTIVIFNSILNLIGLTPGTAYYIQVDRHLTATNGTFGLEVHGLNSCLDPMNLNVTNITDTSANLSWIEIGSATIWNIEWGVTGFAQGTGTMLTDILDNPYLLTGLMPETDYDVFVQANCGEAGLSNWVGPFSFSSLSGPPVNDNICDAIEIIVDVTSQGDAFSNVNSTAQAGEPVASCFNSDIDGSVWFWFTAPVSGNVRVTTDIAGGTLTDTEIAVYEAPTDCLNVGTMGAELGCAQDGGTVVVYNSVLDLSDLTAGATYYIQVDRWGSASNGTFGLEVQGLNVCLDPTSLNATNLTETTADLSWTESGTATIWNIEWGTTGFTQGSGTMLTSITSNPYTLTGLTGETNYDFYIQADCGSGEVSSWVGPFSFTSLPAPPPNDECENAINLIPGVDFYTNPIDGTLLGATSDDEPASCGLNGPGVWYSVIVPEGGAIILEIGPDQATGTTGLDSVLEAFSGECGSLTSLGCNVDGPTTASGFYSHLSLIGLTPGETIYVRVWENGGNMVIPFSISAFNSTLSINDVPFESLKYYPNPVVNELNLKANQIITSIRIYNVLGQEVKSVRPNSMTLKVDMSTLIAGVYLVKVSINGNTNTLRLIKK